MIAPSELHYGAVKIILIYLQGTVHHGITYFADASIILKAFSNSYWVVDLNTRRSVTGYMVFLGNNQSLDN